MSQYIKRSAKKVKGFSSIGVIFAFVILSCILVVGCGAADLPGVSGNGSNNGNYNGTNNGNNSNNNNNNCNGIDTCNTNNYYNNPSQQNNTSSNNTSSANNNANQQSTTSSENCPNAQAVRGPDHPADGTDWTLQSQNGGAIIVNFYFPNVQQYSGNNKVLVPEGTNSITFKGGGGSYWQYQMGCATNAQQDFNTVDHYAAANLQDLINQGLVTVS